MQRAPRRSTLALGWTAFLIVWIIAAAFALTVAGLGPCGGDGGSPFAAPASPAGRYCDAVDSYLESGEPGELTTALVYLWPVLVLMCIGALGVWRRSRRLLLAVAALATTILAVHVGLALSLPDRCSSDDETRAGCGHY
jgi:hypothetical protein